MKWLDLRRFRPRPSRAYSTIGVIVSNIENPFFLDIYKAVETGAHRSRLRTSHGQHRLHLGAFAYQHPTDDWPARRRVGRHRLGPDREHSKWLKGCCSRLDDDEQALCQVPGGLDSEFRGKFEDSATQAAVALLQVLAYANLARTSTVIACLAYPCSALSWHSLRERGRLIHRAD